MKNFAIRGNVERPPGGKPLEAQDAVGVRDFFAGVRQDWIVGLNVLCKLLVLFGSVDTDREVGDVELPDRFAALTERLTFGRSSAGEGFREPGEHDGALALVVGK